jgi:hypothetical protein
VTVVVFIHPSVCELSGWLAGLCLSGDPCRAESVVPHVGGQ